MPSLSSIASSILEQQTILFLGPGVSFNYHDPLEEQRIFESITQEFGNDALEIHQRDGLFILKNQRKREILTRLKSFYEKDYSNSLLEKISEIPFHLIIVTTPDDSMPMAFSKKKLAHKSAYYELKKETVDIATKEMPLIYNLFGSVKGDARKNLFVDHFDLFDYVQALYNPNSNLPDNILSFFTKQRTDTILFLGCDFDKWYFQLVLHLLNIQDIETTDSFKQLNLYNEWDAVYKHGFKINFINDEVEEFIDSLYNQFQTHQLRKPMVQQSADLEGEKRKMEKMVNDQDYPEVFREIKNGNYLYDGLQLSNLENQFAYKIDYQLILQLKVFIESLKIKP